MAKWTVRFFAEASDELEEAEEWLRARDEKVADSWRVKVRNTIRAIADHPEPWAVDQSGIREVRVGDYKYKVVFRLHQMTVEILAIAHTSRRPGYWRRRLRKRYYPESIVVFAVACDWALCWAHREILSKSW